MARKTSDIALLLGSRGRSRSRGGFGRQLLGFVDGLLGSAFSGRSSKSRRRDDRRAGAVSAWALLVAVLVAFGGGFLLGGQFAGAAQKDRNALSANVGDTDGSGAGGRAPAFVGELDTRPLAAQAFVVAAYPNLADLDARQRAGDLAGWLREQGLGKARAYPWPRGDSTLWVVAVYFDGVAEQRDTLAGLAALPAGAPDQTFVQLRNSEPGWPNVYSIR